MQRKNKNIALFTILVAVLLLMFITVSEYNYSINESYLSNNILLYKLLIVFESIIISLLSIYLIITKFNKLKYNEVFNSADKKIIYILETIIISIFIYIVSNIYVNGIHLNYNYYNIPLEEVEINNDNNTYMNNQQEINTNNINLDEYQNDITIKNGGEYEITGTIDHTLVIDTNESITLKLNNAKFNSLQYPAIVNKNNNELTIYLEKDTTNELSDWNDNTYLSCLYSEGKITIDGEGNLNIYGNQTNGKGIYTKEDLIINNGNIKITTIGDGINSNNIEINNGNLYVKANTSGLVSNNLKINNGITYINTNQSLNGKIISISNDLEISNGTLLLAGSNPISIPNSYNKNYLSYELTKVQEKDTLLSIQDSKNKEVISFETQVSTSNIYLFKNNISTKKYTLYTNGKHTGNKVNGIYTDGKYTKGSKLKEVSSN